MLKTKFLRTSVIAAVGFIASLTPQKSTAASYCMCNHLDGDGKVVGWCVVNNNTCTVNGDCKTQCPLAYRMSWSCQSANGPSC